MGKAQREKGKRWEREVASMLREIYGDGVKRGWQSRNGSDAPDIDGSPWWIECKVGARPQPVAALAQATEAAKEANDGRIPIAVCKQDRHAPTVTMRLDDFIDLAKALKAEGVA